MTKKRRCRKCGIIIGKKQFLFKTNLHLDENTDLQVPVAFAGVVQELVTGRNDNRCAIAIFDVESAASSPEHLIILAEHVAEIACSDRQYGTPNREAHPEASRQRHIADIVEFLIANANACKNHLVNGIPQMAIEAHVEVSHVAHAIADTALRIHREGIRWNGDKRKREYNSCQKLFHTSIRQYINSQDLTRSFDSVTLRSG